jgi:hypothetical protein
MVASTCPTSTLSPAFTSIEVTVPVDVKFTDVDNEDAALPLPVTFAVTVPRLTVTVRAVDGGVLGLPMSK